MISLSLLEMSLPVYWKQSGEEDSTYELEKFGSSLSKKPQEARRVGIERHFRGLGRYTLQEAEGKITISFTKDPPDPRALELINKTNQFNLNGKRHTDSSWRQYLNDPKTFLMAACYQDRFGPLGKIAVVAGQSHGCHLNIHQWVMSCRACSRRIEDGCLFWLFQEFDAQEPIFDFANTSRNGPTREFFAQLLGKAP